MFCASREDEDGEWGMVAAVTGERGVWEERSFDIKKTQFGQQFNTSQSLQSRIT